MISNTRQLRLVLAATLALRLAGAPGTAAEENSTSKRNTPIPIAKLKRSTPVDFDRDLLPLLKNNCLACHSKSAAKAGLILETPADILKGGDSGPALVPKKGSASLILKVASHQVEDSEMPPPGNKVQAVNLTPAELGLLKLWIDQGAKPSTLSARTIEWQPLPEHLKAILAVALTPDGRFAACARANQIFVYHLPSGQLVDRLTDPQLLKSGLYKAPGAAHRDLVQSLAFNPDGTLLASGSYREAKLWRRPINPQKASFPVASRGVLFATAVSPDGRQLATGGQDGRVQLLDLTAGKVTESMARHKGAVTTLKFSPDGTRLGSGSRDRTIRVWDVSTGKLFATAHSPAPVNAITWIDNGKQLVSGAGDHVIRVWYLDRIQRELTPLREIRGHDGPVTALEAIPAAPMQILSASGDGSLRVWDVIEGKLLREMKHGGAVAAAAVRPDGKRFASAGVNGVAKLWDAADGKHLADLKGDWRAQERAAETERFLAFAKSEVEFHQAALRLAETNQTAAVDRVKKANESNEKASKALAEAQKKAEEANAAKLAAQKSVEELQALVKRSVEAAELARNQVQEAESLIAKIKDSTNAPEEAGAKTPAETEAKLKAARESKAAADKAVAEAQGKEKESSEKLAAATKAIEGVEKEQKKAELVKSTADTELELAGKAEVQAAKTVEEVRQSIALAESERKQAESEFESARETATASVQPLRTIAFSEDNRALATGGDDAALRLWSAENGAPFHAFEGPSGATFATAFLPDGNPASGGVDRRVIIWDLKAPWTLERVIGTGDARSPLADRVCALKFSPDGAHLATGGGEPTRGGEVILWEAATGSMIRSLTNVHSDVVFGLDFSRDGRHLASSAADKFVRVVELATGKVVRQFEGHTHHVLGVSWRKDGRTLASAGADNVVKTWDFTKGERRKNMGSADKELTSISFVGYSDTTVVSSGDGKVRLLKEDGSEVRAFAGATDFVHSAAATPDGRLIIAGGQDGVLRVWNGTNGELITSFAPPSDR